MLMLQMSLAIARGITFRRRHGGGNKVGVECDAMWNVDVWGKDLKMLDDLKQRG